MNRLRTDLVLWKEGPAALAAIWERIRAHEAANELSCQPTWLSGRGWNYKVEHDGSGGYM